jgi:hypothetical protein
MIDFVFPDDAARARRVFFDFVLGILAVELTVTDPASGSLSVRASTPLACSFVATATTFDGVTSGLVGVVVGVVMGVAAMPVPVSATVARPELASLWIWRLAD